MSDTAATRHPAARSTLAAVGESGAGLPARERQEHDPQGHDPERTCVGCRRRDRQVALLRAVVAQVDGTSCVVPDTRRGRPGRGAWIHPDEGCLLLAVRRRAFHRALRVGGEVQVDLAGFNAVLPVRT